MIACACVCACACASACPCACAGTCVAPALRLVVLLVLGFLLVLPFVVFFVLAVVVFLVFLVLVFVFLVELGDQLVVVRFCFGFVLPDAQVEVGGRVVEDDRVVRGGVVAFARLHGEQRAGLATDEARAHVEAVAHLTQSGAHDQQQSEQNRPAPAAEPGVERRERQRQAGG